jgi:cell division protein FtsA
MSYEEMQEASYKDGRVVVGLDIGTTKICVIAAEVSPENDFRVIGFGESPSEGLNRGVVTNIRAAVKSIRKAIEECQLKSGIEINDIYAGIAGHHILGLNKDGVVAVTGDTISESDIQRVIESARATNSPDKEILHTLIQEYIVDGQDGVNNPIGMAGKRLEAKVHIILGSVTSAANIVQCCNNADLNVRNVVLEPFASSIAVLEEEEKELGVVLLDIGGGTSDMVIYKNGSIIHTSVLPLGGNQVTNDIAIGLRTTKIEALKIKHEQGTALVDSVKKGEVLTLKGIAGREDRIIDKRLLAEVIEARFREIFQLIKAELGNTGFGPGCAAGIVLTGGSSLMNDIDMLAEDVMGMPVRIGSPVNIKGLSELVESPKYATAIGLIKYGIDADLETTFLKENADNIFVNVAQSFKKLVKNFFGIF